MIATIGIAAVVSAEIGIRKTGSEALVAAAIVKAVRAVTLREVDLPMSGTQIARRVERR